jgi:hypothetical protein
MLRNQIRSAQNQWGKHRLRPRATESNSAASTDYKLWFGDFKRQVD